MKISIITVCFNSEETIRDTITSIESQSYDDIEYIVVDGGSTDKTFELVKKSPIVTYSVSEPDDGIYDAMNKGIRMATGDIIGILNADDFYADKDVLSQVSKSFEMQSIDAVYADLVYVNQKLTKKVVRLWKSKAYTTDLFKQAWVPPHPTFFVRKRVYDEFGMFKLKYQLAADFELLFRMIEVKKINTVYLPKILVKMRIGGATNSNLSNIIKQNKEIVSVLKAHYDDFSTIKWASYKLFDRITQFIKSNKL